MKTVKRCLTRMSRVFFAGLKRFDRWCGRSPIESMSIEQLRQLQADSSELESAGFVIVDVRSRAEQNVSMIPGAFTRGAFEQEIDKHRQQTAVAYCTAGGRSYLYARKLAQSGIRAFNLSDGIVGWCQAGLPLCTSDGASTRRVHLNDAPFEIPHDYQVV